MPNWLSIHPHRPLTAKPREAGIGRPRLAGFDPRCRDRSRSLRALRHELFDFRNLFFQDCQRIWLTGLELAGRAMKLKQSNPKVVIDIPGTIVCETLSACVCQIRGLGQSA